MAADFRIGFARGAFRGQRSQKSDRAIKQDQPEKMSPHRQRQIPQARRLSGEECTLLTAPPTLDLRDQAATFGWLAEHRPDVAVDLEAQEIRGPDGGCITFEMDPFRKRCLVEGLDNIGLTLTEEKEITSYEAKAKTARPWA